MPEIHLYGFGEKTLGYRSTIATHLHKNKSRLKIFFDDVVIVCHPEVVVFDLKIAPEERPYIQIVSTEISEIILLAKILKEVPDCPDIVGGPLPLFFTEKGKSLVF